MGYNSVADNIGLSSSFV